MEMVVETVVEQRMFRRCDVVVAEETCLKYVDGFSKLSALLWNQNNVRVARMARLYGKQGPNL